MELHKPLEQFFGKWDDWVFRNRMPALLSQGWQQLTHRQIKRHVCKWRKSQHVWRFEEQGGFRDYVLGLMGEKDFAKLREGQKEEHWQTYRGGGPESDAAEGLGAARASGRDAESRDRSSRGRGPHGRRIAGLESSDS